MAERRMFSKTIIGSARFLRMPISCQALYFHLGLHADDDGIVEAYPILKMVGCTEDDLKVLVAKEFIQVLNEDLVSYITDWNVHNQIRPDRKIDSIYKDLLIQMNPDVKLIEKRPRADTKRTTDGQQMDAQWTADGQQMDRIGKYSIGEVSLGKDSIGEVSAVEDAPQRKSTRFTPPTLEEVTAYCFERGNNVDPQRFIDYYTSNGWMVGRNKMKDFKAAIRNWERKDNDKPAAQKPAKKNDFHKFQQHDYDIDAIERMLDLQDIAEVEAMRKGGG